MASASLHNGRRFSSIATVVCGVVTLGLACVSAQQGEAPRSPQPATTALPVTMTDVVTGLEFPWGLAFLPDGRMLVTERAGRLRVVTRDGKLGEPLAGVPPVLYDDQGGLLDVVLDPRFAQNRLIYVSYAEPGEGSGVAGTSVARAELGTNGLENLRVIYRQQPKLKGSAHFGSRLVFRPDGTIFVTQGERFDYREQSQDLMAGLGKIIRINTDGSVPRDNPFTDRKDARPIVSYGVNYNRTPIGEGITSKPGMAQPVYYWDPNIAPSGMTFYTGDRFPSLKGAMLISSLRGGLVHLTIKDDRVVGENRYVQKEAGRTRHVVQGPDGFIYLLIDNEKGRIVRLSPN